MPRQERSDVPNWSIDIAAKIARTPVAAYLSGSGSSQYRQVEWLKVGQVKNPDLQPTDLYLTEADPDSNIAKAVIRRLMDKAVILQTYQPMIEELAEENKGQFAAAYTYSSVTRAATITDIQADQCRRYSVGLREGPNDFGVGLGVFVEDTGDFITSSMLNIIHHAPIKEIEELYPQAVLI